MKKFMLLLVPVVFIGMGCTHSYQSVETSGVSINPEGSATYKILGDTEGKATVTQILFFIMMGDTGKTASFPGASGLGLLGAGAKTICEQAAAYKALQNYTDADQIICPRFKTELVTDFMIYKVYESTCNAKAVMVK